MTSEYLGRRSKRSSASSSTTTTPRTHGSTSSPTAAVGQAGPISHASEVSPASPHTVSYLGASYDIKGKRRASQDDLCAQFPNSSVSAPASSPNEVASSSATYQTSPSPPPYPSDHFVRFDRERCKRKGRDVASRSVAPSPLRSAMNTSPTTGSASQFVSLLGQPAAVSASISAPENGSAAASSAALPSLYKASRGRSINVSPSRRWDRRGASATVLSGASASGSGGEGEGDDPCDGDTDNARAHSPSRRLSVSKEEALFPSDDDSPPFSPIEELSHPADATGNVRRGSRRWSSIERERRRGMRILLQEHSSPMNDSVATLRVVRHKSSSRRRTRSTLRASSAADGDGSDIELSSSPSSCSSSCDLNYIPTSGDTAAIPIQDVRSRPNARTDDLPTASVTAVSSQGQVASSNDESDDFSPAASTPSTSLVQRSPPGLTALKSITAIPVTSEADPLLGLATPSVEDLIHVDQVEYFPEEAITAQLASDKTKRKTSPKRIKKSSWIIGDFESEPESEDEARSAQAKLATTTSSGIVSLVNASPPSPATSSYQARFASIQSQLRIWSRNPEMATISRVRETSSGSEGQADTDAEAKDADSTASGILSASWRNLARLPNLILMPGLAARQARESLAASSRAHGGHNVSDGKHISTPPTENDFAQIYRLASSTQGSCDERMLQAQRDAALKTGRPASPSPNPSPPTSLLGSRQSSDDSISTTSIANSARSMGHGLRNGRGVASPLEADRDPSAYVSGLGQPIDPDTELSSVVQLQTFRSRSRSRPADAAHRTGGTDSSRSHSQQERREATRSPCSPQKLGQPIQLDPRDENKRLTSAVKADGPVRQVTTEQNGAVDRLAIQIPVPSRSSRRDLFADGPVPKDTASAPTSPTFRSACSSCTSSADEAETSSPSRKGDSLASGSVDADGFRTVRRRPHRRASGSRSLRPKVDALVPQGYSAFAIEEGDEKTEGSDSDGDVTPSPARTRRSRGGRGRGSSPRRSNRQCAVGLFGGGQSAGQSSLSNESPSSPRSRFGSRREGSHLGISSPVRTVRSSPDLTYAAAAAAAAARESEADGQEATRDDPSPPRGSRGRRGAVKVVASSVGQRASLPQPLLLAGVEGVGRGPSYPPRAIEILEDGLSGDVGEQTAPASSGAHGGRGRSASTSSCGNAFPQPFRFRLLSNSSHLLMLSLELDMIKKQKISAPLKPRWGKHRANDFVPLPSTILYRSAASCLFASSDHARPRFSDSRGEDIDAENGDSCEQRDCQPCATPTPVAAREGRGRSNRLASTSASTIGGSLRDPSSRLRFSWSTTDIAAALESASHSRG